MGVVTGRTVAFFDRAMNVRVIIEKVHHVHNGAVRSVHLFVVADQAEIHGRTLKLFGELGSMGSVAVETVLILSYRIVLDIHTFNKFFLVLMTVIAGIRRR